ncbi:hypothetical protein PM082_013470 [Marasmius tenuissimus]|nr:hypothetical protein PM082_013470 [Marasmius tenuissimus]
MKTTALAKMAPAEFLPRMVPHLYETRKMTHSARRRCFLYTGSPLARASIHSQTAQEFSFTVVGTSGTLTGYSVKGRVIPHERLLIAAKANKVFENIVARLSKGHSIVLLDVTRFAISRQETVDWCDVKVPFDFTDFLRHIVFCLKDRFNFPFYTEYEVTS